MLCKFFFNFLKNFTQFTSILKLNITHFFWSPCSIKDINQLESIRRKFTRIIFNQCNVSYISYIDRRTKLTMKILEYRRIEYNLITFFKLVNNDTTIDSQTFLNLIKINTHSEVIIKSIHANITSIMLVAKILFSIVQ